MPRKKSTKDDGKKDALLFAAKLVANDLQKEKALGKLKEHIKLKEHVSELEAEKIIEHVHKIQTDTPDPEKTQSTSEKLLTFFRSKPDESSQPSPRPADPDQGATKKKKPKNN